VKAVALSLLRAFVKAPFVNSCLPKDCGSFLRKKRSNSALIERWEVLRKRAIRLGRLKALLRVKSLSETRCVSRKTLLLYVLLIRV